MNMNFPQVCFGCSMAHIRRVEDVVESDDGSKVWHKNCVPKNMSKSTLLGFIGRGSEPFISKGSEPNVPTLAEIVARGYTLVAAESVVAEQQKLHDEWVKGGSK